VLFQPLEAVTHSTFDVWTEDVVGVEERKQIEEATPSTGPYLLRRIAAGAIDHTILVVLLIAVLFGFSVMLGESIKWLVVSAWMATISLFLLMHFIYHLYFLRASRQTPGMLFLSLELRDPGSQVIPVGKIIFRWFTFIILNVFNILPAFMGKPFLLHDHVSSTEMRSFK
jgi:uncharacterized RDD family membrane protein YckC